MEEKPLKKVRILIFKTVTNYEVIRTSYQKSKQKILTGLPVIICVYDFVIIDLKIKELREGDEIPPPLIRVF